MCASGTLIHLWSRFSGTRESKPSYGLVGLSIVVHICIMCKYYIPSRHGTCMYVICFVVSHEQNNRKRKNMCKEFFMTLSRLQQYYFNSLFHTRNSVSF